MFREFGKGVHADVFGAAATRVRSDTTAGRRGPQFDWTARFVEEMRQRKKRGVL